MRAKLPSSPPGGRKLENYNLGCLTPWEKTECQYGDHLPSLTGSVYCYACFQRPCVCPSNVIFLSALKHAAKIFAGDQLCWLETEIWPWFPNPSQGQILMFWELEKFYKVLVCGALSHWKVCKESWTKYFEGDRKDTSHWEMGISSRICLARFLSKDAYTRSNILTFSINQVGSWGGIIINIVWK